MQGHSRAPGSSPISDNLAQARHRGPINPGYQARPLVFDDENACPPGGHPDRPIAQPAVHRIAGPFMAVLPLNIPPMNAARQAELAQRQARLAAYRASLGIQIVVPGG